MVTKYSMNPSLYERDTFWAMFTGQSSLLLARCNFGQINYQRCRSVEKRSDLNKYKILLQWRGNKLQKDIKLLTFCRGLVCAIIGYFGIYTGCLFTGLVLYAHYHDCDPIKAGVNQYRSKKIIPSWNYYVISACQEKRSNFTLFRNGCSFSHTGTAGLVFSWHREFGSLNNECNLEYFEWHHL